MEENTNQNRAGDASSAQDQRMRKPFIIFALGLLAVSIYGLYWIFTQSTNSPIGAGWFLFSFAAGLSMIVLPCTLPLAFVIVPLSMGKGYVKGFSVALAFGLGVAITLSLYGILAAVLGKALFGFTGGSGEIIKNIFYAIAGVFAIVFALGELKLLNVRLPSYMGAVPGFIQKRKDIAKALMLGLFLGNIGVGCPHPATPIILGQIAVVGDVFYGWLLFFVHAMGRVIPLLLLAVLGILGINAIKSLVKHKDKIARATAWGMVFVGAFLFTLGFFSHDWWVYSGTHSLLEQITQEERFTNILSEQLGAAPAHRHGPEELVGKTGFFGLPLWFGNWTLVLLMVIPLWWYLAREQKQIASLPETERAVPSASLHSKKWSILLLTVLLALVFTHTLPQWFLNQAMQGSPEEKVSPVTVFLSVNPTVPAVGVPTQLTFSLRDAKNIPVQGLQIDHERILHVIIVGEDFQTFTHIHPENFGPITPDMLRTATFSVSYVFPKQGRYLVSVNYLHEKHKGAQQFLLDAGGMRGVSLLVKDFTRVKAYDGYTVTFASDPIQLRAGESTTLSYFAEHNGRPVTDMEPYLGAPMHVAIVSADLSSFLHTHGEVHDPVTGAGIHEFFGHERFGPQIEVHAVFPHPGLYQIFGEFKHQGRVVATSFMVEVGKGTEIQGREAIPQGH